MLMDNAADRIVRRLLQLTSKERRLLLSGRLEDLPNLTEKKFYLLRHLSAVSVRPHPNLLERLKGEAARN